HDRAEIFRVELAGEHRRVHQVTKQYSELAPFCLGGGGRGLWHRRQGGGWRRSWRRRSVPCPDQHCLALIDGQALALNEFDLQILQRLIIELELPLERAIRD